MLWRLLPILLLLAACGPRPAPADLPIGSMATPGQVERVTRGLLSAKAEAEAMALACDAYRFDDAAFARADATWTRAIAELAAQSPRTLFDGLRRLGYAEPYDRFLDRVRDGGGVPDVAAGGPGGALVNLGGQLGLTTLPEDMTCADGDRAIRAVHLSGTFLRADA